MDTLSERALQALVLDEEPPPDVVWRVWEAMKRIVALHQEGPRMPFFGHNAYGRLVTAGVVSACNECHTGWPCSTLRILAAGLGIEVEDETHGDV